MNTIDRDAVIEECIQCYSPDDTAEDWADSMRRLKSQPAQPCSKPNALQVAFEKMHGLTQPDPRDEALRLAESEMEKAKAASGWDLIPHEIHIHIDAVFAAIDALKGK